MVKRFSFFSIGLFSAAIAFQTSALAQNKGVPAKESVSALTPAQIEAVKTVVHEYLVASPEVLIEASKSLQEKQRQKAQEDAEKGVKENFKKLVDSKTSAVIGNPKGNVILVEFMDYQCGHCKTMSTVIGELIKKNKNLKVVIKELPIFGEKSEFAAKAALAAIKQSQDKFIAFQKALFNSKLRLSEKVVMDLAKSSHLNINKLRQEMKNPAIKQELDENIKLAGELKLPGTPAFLIANKEGTEVAFIPGAIPNPEKEFQKLIDKASSKKGSIKNK